MDSENSINHIINELMYLRTQLDEVRTKDIPNVKIEVATLVRETKLSSKIHSTIGAMCAVFISYWTGHFK